MEEQHGTIKQNHRTIEENHGNMNKKQEKSMKIMDKSVKTMDNSINHGTNSDPSGKMMNSANERFEDKMQQLRNFSCNNQGREPGRPKKNANLIPPPILFCMFS